MIFYFKKYQLSDLELTKNFPHVRVVALLSVDVLCDFLLYYLSHHLSLLQPYLAHLELGLQVFYLCFGEDGKGTWVVVDSSDHLPLYRWLRCRPHQSKSRQRLQVRALCLLQGGVLALVPGVLVHVLELFYLPHEIIDYFLDIFKLLLQFAPLLSEHRQFLDEVGIVLGGPLDFLVPPPDGAVSPFVDINNLVIDVGDMPLDLVESPGVMVVPFVLAHEFDVSLVDGFHLVLVVCFLGVFGLDCFLYLVCNLFDASSSLLCRLSLLG